MMSRKRNHRTALVVIRGEICVIIGSLRRTARWASHQQESKSDIILRKLQALKDSLDTSSKSTGMKINVDANYFLVPFLDVIRSEETSGPVTSLALAAIEKFISYEIINEANGSAGAVEAITDAVIHAHFVSTDSASDELVLMKILNVLHRLFLSPLGQLLSNESVCELMQACFRMCFIDRANELLRKSAEASLTDMIRLLFSRLHTFPVAESIKKYNSNAFPTKSPVIAFEPLSLSEPSEEMPSTSSIEVGIQQESKVEEQENGAAELGSEVASVEGNRTSDEPCNTPAQSAFPDAISPESDVSTALPAKNYEANPLLGTPTMEISHQEPPPFIYIEEPTPPAKVVVQSSKAEFKNASGVKFTIGAKPIVGDNLQNLQAEEDWMQPTIVSPSARGKITVPYGIPCVRELFRFLLSLINPHEKQNSELMIHLGLKLLLVSIETGVDAIALHTPLMSQVKNELCKNLIGLLSYFPPPSSGASTSSSIILTSLRILCMVFENLRYALKYQLEHFLIKMGDLINESSAPIGPGAQSHGKWNYEQREIAIDFLIQLWKLPCFVTELYLNYDCDLFCSNLFEDTTKLLSKNAFPMQTGLNSTHLLCLDGLLSILDGIEGHCTQRITTNPNVSGSSSGGSDESNSSVFYHNEGSPDIGSGNQLIEGTRNLGNQFDLDSKVIRHSKNVSNSNIPSVQEESLLPTHEQLMAIRHKKKIFHTGSEQFNNSASKGIKFLQAHGVLSDPLEPHEVGPFLRENTLLDKRAIGDYISNRKHSDILHEYVASFDFARLRLDEALRIFLETFRLPGEAGPIALILEEFSAHWSKSNGNPFANVDAAYILAYQVIMLNVDQHNTNVKKQGNSMTLDGLKANLKGCNGGKDFDPEMLKDIYNSIRSEEIVMPAEQVGAVKENYMWKVLIRRGMSSGAKFQSPAGTDEGVYDHDLFSLSWGPIVAALSFIFDKSGDSALISKTLMGFHKCATISAHYGMSDVFDNLIISLCKFTTLISGNGADLSTSIKSQSSCRLVFQLTHRHGDILREGWKNFVECLISLFKLQVLPKILTESEDFTEPSGRISLIRRSQISAPRQETGLFSSLYSYIALSADSPGSKSSIAEEEENKRKTQVLVMECRPELLLSESKFLQMESLLDLIKALVSSSPIPDSKRKDADEDQTAFVLEVLLKITIQNRDRALEFWDIVQDHLFATIMASATNDMPYILERATVGLLRVTLRLMRKEDLCSRVLQSLKILLYLRPAAVIQLSQQLSFGLHEILKTTAANIHSMDEWTIIFTVLEYIGAGKLPPTLTSTLTNPHPPLLSTSVKTGKEGSSTLQHSLSQDPIPQYSNSGQIGYSSGSDRGYTSDSELEIRSSSENGRMGNVSPAQSWILLTQEDQQLALQNHDPSSPRRIVPTLQQQPQPTPERQLFYPDPKSLVKSCESLSFLVRDAAHITPDNFTLCVGAIRSFVEASTMKVRPSHALPQPGNKKKRTKKVNEQHGIPKSKSFSASISTAYDADESDNEDQAVASQQVSVQLLDLLHTLHTRAAQIFQWWQKEISGSGNTDEMASLWSLGWKPLLQAIVILCSDSRKQVRTVALTYLQRALLVHDLQQLTPVEWLSCFNEVLFPLMCKLLEPLNPTDAAGMEETRMRAATLLCKVFLQHLTPLLQLEEFNTLWLQILDYLDKYMHHSVGDREHSELLMEAIPESLKNLLLVMETAGVFHTPDGYTKLWALTWEKIDSFLPSLRAELIRAAPSVSVEAVHPHLRPGTPLPTKSGAQTAEIVGDSGSGMTPNQTTEQSQSIPNVPSVELVDDNHSASIQEPPSCLPQEPTNTVPFLKLEDPSRPVASPTTSHTKVEYTSICFGDAEDEVSKL